MTIMPRHVDLAQRSCPCGGGAAAGHCARCTPVRPADPAAGRGLGPNAGAFTDLVTAARQLSPLQVTLCLEAAEEAVAGPEFDEAAVRAANAAEVSGRYGAAFGHLTTIPGPAYWPAVAVLVADLLPTADVAVLTRPWHASCVRIFPRHRCLSIR